jgi:aryl-alcohol dehydrogenase-like predicted oxidoreductase
MVLSHCATSKGTDDYRKRMPRVSHEHFSKAQSLWISSIGLGTYLGNHDDSTDASYRKAIMQAVQLGCNHIDSAINYRFQRSERIIGEALKDLFREGKTKREEIVIATKGGFIPFDNAPPSNPTKYLQETFIQTGLITHGELVEGCHCLSPRYLDDQLDRSRQNLGLDTIDIYYLHNPEMQLGVISRKEFYSRMRSAFETLEKNIKEGKIQYYGTATWNGYRNQPTAVDYLALSDLVEIAREVGGEDHHFRFIQLPFNLAMPEAFTFANQQVGDDIFSTIEAAGHFDISVVTSAAIMQTRLAHNLPDEIRHHFTGLHTDAQRSIQFVRSTPGVTTALVGMSRQMHVEENLHVATRPPLPLNEFLQLFSAPEE